MTFYLDSSVLLRVVLGQPDQLASWGAWDHVVTSALTEIECLRTLDRRFRQGRLAEDELAHRRGLLLHMIAATERVPLGGVVLRRAAEPFPTALGTLDGLHLASALLWSQSRETPIVMCTHDLELARAARAVGLAVQGV